MPARVAVNGRFLGQPLTGVQRYARGILAALPDHQRAEWLVVPFQGPARSVAGAPATTAGAAGGARGHAWEQVVLPQRARGVGAAVLVNLCQAAPVAWGRQVVVLHDASPLRHPEYFTRSYAVAAGALLRALARSRALVVTVSPFARAELRDVLGIPEERLTVLRPGAPELRPDALLRGEDLAGGPYALFVGGHDPRKNLELLTAIWPEVWLRHGLRLVVVGRPGTTVHRAEDPQPAEWLTRIGGPSDSTLGALHRDAVCLLAPSHYEGFGLPLLEASTQGTPFLATPTGAAPELAVRGWQIVPPDRGAWLAGIDRVLSLGDEEWRGVRHDARERAASYRWDSSARQLVGLVEQAAA